MASRPVRTSPQVLTLKGRQLTAIFAVHRCLLSASGAKSQAAWAVSPSGYSGHDICCFYVHAFIANYCLRGAPGTPGGG